MYIYTVYNGKTLRMPVPKDWSMDEINYFLTGKEEGKTDFNPKPHLSLTPPPPPPPEPPFQETACRDRPCEKHPQYNGMRTSKRMAGCVFCIMYYNARRSHGDKETRKRPEVMA